MVDDANSGTGHRLIYHVLLLIMLRYALRKVELRRMKYLLNSRSDKY